MKSSISVLKVKNKVKKTVKRADDRIKPFNKFITGIKLIKVTIYLN